MLLRLLVAGLLVLGGWQLGKGFYLEIKAEVAQWLLEEAWDDAVNGFSHAKPWPWADTWALARISFPGHRREFIVLEGASGRSLAFAPAHLMASVKPGDNGVSVIGGHRDTHFKILKDVARGDEVWVEYPDTTLLVFRVTDIQVIDVTESRIQLERDVPVLALVSCYPFIGKGGNSNRRYVVVAERHVNHQTQAAGSEDVTLGKVNPIRSRLNVLDTL